MNYFEEEEYTESKFDFQIWKKIFSYTRAFRKHLYIGIFAAIILALVDVIYPQINRFAITMA